MKSPPHTSGSVWISAHPVDNDRELYIYDKDIRVGRIKFVDKRQNARTFKPCQSEPVISYADAKVKK